MNQRSKQPSTKSTTSSPEDALQQCLADTSEQLLEAIREIVQGEVADVCGEMESRLGESLAAEGGGGGEALLEHAADLFATKEFKGEIRRQLEEAFQSVLPGLVKRFKSEIEERVSQPGEGSPADVDGIVNSSEMKEMLEERFRAMVLYLKQDVIPKVVHQMMSSA